MLSLKKSIINQVKRYFELLKQIETILKEKTHYPFRKEHEKLFSELLDYEVKLAEHKYKCWESRQSYLEFIEESSMTSVEIQENFLGKWTID